MCVIEAYFLSPSFSPYLGNTSLCILMPAVFCCLCSNGNNQHAEESLGGQGVQSIFRWKARIREKKQKVGKKRLKKDRFWFVISEMISVTEIVDWKDHNKEWVSFEFQILTKYFFKKWKSLRNHFKVQVTIFTVFYYFRSSLNYWIIM